MTDTGFIQPKAKAPRFAQSQKQDALYYDYTMDRVLFAGGEDLDRFVVWDYVKMRRTIIG